MARLVGCQASRLIGYSGHLTFAAAEIAQANSCDALRRLWAVCLGQS
jgi:hypothetical protein